MNEAQLDISKKKKEPLFREAGSPEALRAAMIGFVSRFTWSHFATLTMGDAEWEASASSARRYFERGWIRSLERAAQNRVTWFWVLEGGTGNTRRHIHALIGGADRLSPSWMADKWKLGHAQISLCTDSGPVAYLLKSLSCTWDEFDMYGVGRHRNVSVHQRRARQHRSASEIYQ